MRALKASFKLLIAPIIVTVAAVYITANAASAAGGGAANYPAMDCTLYNRTNPATLNSDETFPVGKPISMEANVKDPTEVGRFVFSANLDQDKSVGPLDSNGADVTFVPTVTGTYSVWVNLFAANGDIIPTQPGGCVATLVVKNAPATTPSNTSTTIAVTMPTTPDTLAIVAPTDSNDPAPAAPSDPTTTTAPAPTPKPVQIGTAEVITRPAATPTTVAHATTTVKAASAPKVVAKVASAPLVTSTTQSTVAAPAPPTSLDLPASADNLEQSAAPATPAIAQVYKAHTRTAFLKTVVVEFALAFLVLGLMIVIYIKQQRKYTR